MMPAVDMTNVSLVRELLSEERFKIKLHDHVALQVREVLEQTTDETFPVSQQSSQPEFEDRLHRYESILRELIETQVLLCFWAEPYHRSVLTLAPKSLGCRRNSEGGIAGSLALRYPLTLLLYAGGVAAIAARRYDNLYELMTTQVSGQGQKPLDRTLIGVASETVDLHNAFKALPGHERQRVPRSEYIYELLKPTIEGIVFSGMEYEDSFDRFEVLCALEYAHRLSTSDDRHVWAPIGRFGWKYHATCNPYEAICEEARQEGLAWNPFRAGFFGGSLEKFLEIAAEYGKLVARRCW